MGIPSDEIPQADVITDVIRTVISVSQGAESFQDIASAINKVERQGRYYRKAAEIIGLIQTPTRNHSVLTSLGDEFMRTGPTLTNPLLIQGVLQARIFQRLLPFLELHSDAGVSRSEIEDFIHTVADISTVTMIPRRFSSVVSWLEDLHVIERRGERFFLSIPVVNNSVGIVSFEDVDEPLLPRTTDLQEYRTLELRNSSAREAVITYQNAAALERADNAHRRLVNLVASRIKISGSIPRFNQIIDLAARHNNEDFIFEMKSITDGNSKSQVRRALSQLYEYKYLQNLPNSNLVLVLERPLPSATHWMIDYLEQERNINVIWDGDDRLYG